MIALHWEGSAIHPIYIFVSKDKLVLSENPLIDEPSLKTYNIASYYRGKYLYLWITIQNGIIKINFSGSSEILYVTHPNLENNGCKFTENQCDRFSFYYSERFNNQKYL